MITDLQMHRRSTLLHSVDFSILVFQKFYLAATEMRFRFWMCQSNLLLRHKKSHYPGITIKYEWITDTYGNRTFPTQNASTVGQMHTICLWLRPLSFPHELFYVSTWFETWRTRGDIWRRHEIWNGSRWLAATSQNLICQRFIISTFAQLSQHSFWYFIFYSDPWTPKIQWYDSLVKFWDSIGYKFCTTKQLFATKSFFDAVILFFWSFFTMTIAKSSSPKSYPWKNMTPQRTILIIIFGL